MKKEYKVRRSALITPADKEFLIRKLATSEADYCLIELEDGVHPSKKEEARQIAARLLTELDWGSRERVVRINSIHSEDAAADIAAVTPSRPEGIMLTKVESPDELRIASDLLSKAEAKAGIEEGSIELWSMIETAKGLCAVEDIAAADDRVAGLFFGGGDFGADIGVKRLGLGVFRRFPPPSHEYIYARGRIVAAARANGIDPIDVGFATFGDMEGTRQAAELSAQMGFAGAGAVSPKQVPIVNEVFTPPPEDIDWATRAVKAFEAEGEKDDAGTVVVVDGEMVDGPFIVNARQILERFDRIRDFEARKGSAPVGR